MSTSKTSKKPPKTYKISEFIYTDSPKVADQFAKEKYPKFYTLFIRTFSPRDEIEKVVSQMELDEYAYIEHDEDLKEDGSPKEAHFHLLLYRKAGFRLTHLIKTFTQNTLVQVCVSKKKSYEYLTHKNDKNKAQYPASSIVEYHRDGLDTFSVTAEEARANQYEQMLDDIEQLSRREMGIKYGRDYMLNFERYEKFSSIVREEDEHRENEERIAHFNSVARITDDIRCIDTLSGDFLRLSFADVLVREMVVEIQEKINLPSEKDILKWYRAFVYKIIRARQNNGLFEVSPFTSLPESFKFNVGGANK